MKKIVSVILLVCTLICGVFPVTSFAESNTTPNFEMFTKEDFEATEHYYAVYPETRASGLIVTKSFGIQNRNGALRMYGITNCSSDVVKCGFSKLLIERRVNSSSSWRTYETITGLCEEGTSYTLSVSIDVDSGYQYRVTATHYAKKSIFSVEKIEAISTVLTF